MCSGVTVYSWFNITSQYTLPKHQFFFFVLFFFSCFCFWFGFGKNVFITFLGHKPHFSPSYSWISICQQLNQKVGPPVLKLYWQRSKYSLLLFTFLHESNCPLHLKTSLKNITEISHQSWSRYSLTFYTYNLY